MENTLNQPEVFVQGPKSEVVEKALSTMKELREKYENVRSEKDDHKEVDLNLYEFPKMMESIWEVEVENISNKEKGILPFIIEKTPEYKEMAKYGLTLSHIERQRELAQEKR